MKHAVKLLVLASALLSASLHSGPAPAAADDAVDLFAVMIGETPWNSRCCCTLKSLAVARAITGAREEALAFIAADREYEVYLRLAPRTHVFIGVTETDEQGVMRVHGPGGHGILAMAPAQDGSYVWAAYLDGREAGRGTMH